MDFLPILSTLRRHKIAAALIVLQIALTCAIVCNAVFLIRERLRRMDTPSGVVEDELVRISLTGIGTDSDPKALTATDLAALRALPHVKSAAVSNMLPFANSSWNTDVSTNPDDLDRGAGINSATWAGSDQLVKTLGVELVAGRDFTPDEFVDFDNVMNQKTPPPSIILTRSLADRLLPGKNPIGQKVYGWGKTPSIVVGVIDRLARPDDAHADNPGDGVLFPIRMPYSTAGNYVLRVEPGHQADVLAAAQAALDGVDPNRIALEHQTMAEIRAKHFEADRAMAWLLLGVCVALLLITALGIVGLASFWVQQRTRQIGIRRALGASRGQILRYFQTENFILATAGIVLGMALAYGINVWLMDAYKVQPLPASFLPIGAVLLWMLGQIAVLGPALRASAVPPAVATRTV